MEVRGCKVAALHFIHNRGSSTVALNSLIKVAYSVMFNLDIWFCLNEVLLQTKGFQCQFYFLLLASTIFQPQFFFPSVAYQQPP